MRASGIRTLAFPAIDKASPVATASYCAAQRAEKTYRRRTATAHSSSVANCRSTAASVPESKPLPDN